MEIGLRRAGSADLAAVAVIERASFADPWSERSFVDLVDAPHVCFLVAHGSDPNIVLGYAVMLVAGGQAELSNFAIAPAVRRRAIGGRLLDAMIDAASSRGAFEIFLDVRASNAGARALYASREFREFAVRRAYYRSPVEDGIILRRVAGAAAVEVPGGSGNKKAGNA
jgi:ribosomal-protein-alanine N-acetyltransferase